jgi:transposase
MYEHKPWSRPIKLVLSHSSFRQLPETGFMTFLKKVRFMQLYLGTMRRRSTARISWMRGTDPKEFFLAMTESPYIPCSDDVAARYGW